MNPIRVSPAANPHKPSFGGLSTVRYVTVDGHVNEDPAVIEQVTKEFAKTLKKATPQNHDVRWEIKNAISDFMPNIPEQSITLLKPNPKKGIKSWNIVTGDDAFAIKKIWSKGWTSAKQKNADASEYLKNLFRKGTKKIAIIAETVDVKGKIKYIIKRAYITI